MGTVRSVKTKRTAILASAILAVLLTGCSLTVTHEPDPAGAAPAVPSPDLAAGDPVAGSRGEAAGALDQLPVKGRAPKTGYDRDLFGDGWLDLDGDGCDTRNETLSRQLTDLTFREATGNCIVETGTLADPYSGTQIAFTRGKDTSIAVQIDHVVALSDSWQKGAQPWDGTQRAAFANDPLNLLAVDGPLNSQKSDGDAATWLPPNKSYRCDYVARQVAVKAKWGLWVTQAEKDAIAGELAKCPGQALPVAP